MSKRINIVTAAVAAFMLGIASTAIAADQVAMANGCMSQAELTSALVDKTVSDSQRDYAQYYGPSANGTGAIEGVYGSGKKPFRGTYTIADGVVQNSYPSYPHINWSGCARWNGDRLEIVGSSGNVTRKFNVMSGNQL